ncbi:hypothetical protein PGIGA_G00201070 [Pangasianodon gigas]|uniref:Uncharacterized protein n=1 Tax=Pangasianodon gigas TaxID=30993 RepID=A0ACC5WEE4_PANGG|nr:hypothetical protein [Pangasianodon gigas]
MAVNRLPHGHFYSARQTETTVVFKKKRHFPYPEAPSSCLVCVCFFPPASRSVCVCVCVSVCLSLAGRVISEWGLVGEREHTHTHTHTHTGDVSVSTARLDTQQECERKITSCLEKTSLCSHVCENDQSASE